MILVTMLVLTDFMVNTLIQLDYIHKGDVCEMFADSINNTNLSYYFCLIVHFDQLRCDEWHQLLWIYCNYIDKMNLRSLDDRSSA